MKLIFTNKYKSATGKTLPKGTVILEVGTMLMKHIMVVRDLKKLYTD